MPTRFGTQPGHQILISQGRTISAVARIIGVVPAHLNQALQGRIRPNYTVREKLPVLLDVPLEELFTEDALQPPRVFLSSAP